MTNLKTVVVLSGKGGAGKTTLTASLAILLAKNHKITVADCDVDAPNLAIALGLDSGYVEQWDYLKTSEKAYLNKQKCEARQNCLLACNFSAIRWDEFKKLPDIIDFLCVGCGACQTVCPAGAIALKEVENGKIGSGCTPYGFSLISGNLNIGESGSGRLVDEVKLKAQKISAADKSSLLLIDAAAGLGCPVIASVKGSDFVILVTEPTNVAFSDLKRSLDVVNHFNIPHGIVINRWNMNKEFTNKLEKFAKSENIDLLGKIPYNRSFVDALVNLKPAIIYEEQLEELFSDVLLKTLSSIDL